MLDIPCIHCLQVLYTCLTHSLKLQRGSLKGAMPCPGQAPLVGAVGQEYVHSVLSSLDPQSALREVQRRGAFANKRCDPLLRLLDNLGVKRCAAPTTS